MKNSTLTKKQEAILIFIKKYIAKNGYPPTVREIASAVNLSSPATVHVHLKNLIEKGYLKRNKKNHRILELLVPNEFETIISDEFSITLFQNNKRNSTFKTLKSSISKYDDIIAFKIDNDNLKDKGILKNDILLFECSTNISNKDVILVNIDKIFYVKDNSKNINKHNIIGKLVQLHREY